MDSLLAGPGDSVLLSVRLFTNGVRVAATGNDLAFDPRVMALDPASCRMSPGIPKTLIVSVVQDEPNLQVLRVFVRADQNLAPIADGTLYTCLVRIAPTAFPASHTVQVHSPVAFTPEGATLEPVVGVDGTVTVTLVAQGCPGDCDGDRVVEPSDLRTAVRIGLEGQLLATCPSLDRNGDGKVTVEEIVAAVRRALDGCLPAA